MKKCFFNFLFGFFIFFSGDSFLVSLENLPAISEVREYSEINLTQVKLTNGMTVWLKPTDFETDEILIKIAAIGGFASLPEKDRYSGEMAANIAWESGMGGMSSDQISVLLYEHSLEFAPKIYPFSRIIEGNSNKQGLSTFLRCVNMIFTEQNFTEEGWKYAQKTAKGSLMKIANDYDQTYESAFLQLNTRGLNHLKPMTTNDLSKVEFSVSKNFFQASFSNPKEFVCVIVGSFDRVKAVQLVNEYLGKISSSKQNTIFNKTFSAPFPSDITQKEIHLNGRPDSLTRLTFPLSLSVNEKNIHSVDFLCQVIEARLRRIITDQMKLSYGIDVFYEFPLYPYLENPWISIRFRSDEKLIPELKQIIIKQLQELKENGVTEVEIEKIKLLEEGSDEYWFCDNFYWVSMLTNYYLWGWNPESIYRGSGKMDDVTAKSVKQLLQNSISLTNYSVVIAKP